MSQSEPQQDQGRSVFGRVFVAGGVSGSRCLPLAIATPGDVKFDLVKIEWREKDLYTELLMFGCEEWSLSSYSAGA
jgi:hypothetical protein